MNINCLLSDRSIPVHINTPSAFRDGTRVHVYMPSVFKGLNQVNGGVQARVIWDGFRAQTHARQTCHHTLISVL